MRTTVEIDEKLLHQAMIVTGAKKKRQVIALALQEVIKQRRIQRLMHRLGRTPLAMTAKNLDKTRADE